HVVRLHLELQAKALRHAEEFGQRHVKVLIARTQNPWIKPGVGAWCESGRLLERGGVEHVAPLRGMIYIRIPDNIHLAELKQVTGVVGVNGTRSPAAEYGVGSRLEMGQELAPASERELIYARNRHSISRPRGAFPLESPGVFLVGVEELLLPLPVVIVSPEKI